MKVSKIENQVFKDLKRIGLKPVIDNRLCYALSGTRMKDEYKHTNLSGITLNLKPDIDNLCDSLANDTLIIGNITKEYF